MEEDEARHPGKTLEVQAAVQEGERLPGLPDRRDRRRQPSMKGV